MAFGIPEIVIGSLGRTIGIGEKSGKGGLIEFFYGEAIRAAIEESRRKNAPPPPPEPERIFRRRSRGLNLAGLSRVLEALQGSAADPTPIPPAPTPVPDPPPIDPTVPAPEPIPEPAPPPVEEIPTLEETVEKVFGGFENVPIFGAGQVIRGVVRPLIPKGFEAVKAIVKRIKRRATEKPSERGRREAIKQREAILREMGRPKNVRVVRRPNVPSVDEVIFTRQDEAIAAARKVEREVLPKTKPAVREIRGTEVKIGEFDTSRLPAKRTATGTKAAQTRQKQRTAAQKAATSRTTTPVGARISISLLTRILTRGSLPTAQGSLIGTGTTPAPIIGTGTSPAPIIGTGTSPAPIIGGTTPAPIIGTGTSPAPSPPFTDPLTPTQTFPGSGTQTQVLQFSRTGSRTKECQEVKRKRKRGRCFEGFYEERFRKTIFTDWREVDCLTGDTLPKLKEA